MSAPPSASLAELAPRYDALLFDAFGVLVTHGGAVPGAPEQVAALQAAGVPCFVVTNDASRHPETAAAWYGRLGYRFAPDEVISSGSLMAPWLTSAGRAGATCTVLGTPDSVRMATEGGARVVSVDEDWDVLFLCDEAGYPVVPTFDRVLNHVLDGVAAGRPPALVLANPDLIYPASATTFGIGAGSLARVLEAALSARLGDAAPSFVGLGKPHPPIFEEATRRAQSRRLLMVGDTLATDVAGALAFGLDVAWVPTGVSPGDASAAGPRPTFRLEGWGEPPPGRP